MRVSEVIEMLRKLPQDYDVMLAYDSMVCISSLTIAASLT